MNAHVLLAVAVGYREQVGDSGAILRICNASEGKAKAQGMTGTVQANEGREK
ncbi:hypothetical protein BH10BAC3_BH10BAC3_12090 [soil metagenome]